MKRKFLLPVITGCILLSIAFILHAYYSKRVITSCVIMIPHGSSASMIAQILRTNDIIRNKYLFITATYITGKGSSFKSGTYKLPSPVSMNDIIEFLSKGRYLIAQTITIPEGFRSWEIASLLMDKAGTDSSEFIYLVHDSNFIH